MRGGKHKGDGNVKSSVLKWACFFKKPLEILSSFEHQVILTALHSSDSAAVDKCSIILDQRTWNTAIVSQ